MEHSKERIQSYKVQVKKLKEENEMLRKKIDEMKRTIDLARELTLADSLEENDD